MLTYLRRLCVFTCSFFLFIVIHKTSYDNLGAICIFILNKKASSVKQNDLGNFFKVSICNFLGVKNMKKRVHRNDKKNVP